MNTSHYVRIFTCLILATTFSVIDNSSALSIECTAKDSNGHCVKVPGNSRQRHGGNSSNDQRKQDDIPSDNNDSAKPIGASYHNWVDEIRQTHKVMKDSAGLDYYAPLDGNNTCYTEDYRPGKQEYSEYTLEDGIAVKNTRSRGNVALSKFCQPNDTKTLTPTNPKETPKGPTAEEMLQEIEDQFANTTIQPPILHQTFNLGLEDINPNDPNVKKNQPINFYVDAPTAHWEGDLMIGHVDIESYPVQTHIQYGNGDEETFYTTGKPVYRVPGEKPQQTATSYVYKRSGNFHAYATVSYSGRFRVNGGDWQALDVVLTKDTVDPLLIRVWWVDVGRVGGTCDEDDTRWGCKNDPTMGKKDNPNPRLRKADIRTGQRWHLNDSGDGDTEYSLHRSWPDM